MFNPGDKVVGKVYKDHLWMIDKVHIIKNCYELDGGGLLMVKIEGSDHTYRAEGLLLWEEVKEVHKVLFEKHLKEIQTKIKLFKGKVSIIEKYIEDIDNK